MYKLSSRVRTTHGQDGGVVLDIRQGQMFNLNLVGSRILELVKNGTDERAIVDKIGVEFDVPRGTAEHDVQEFIHVLRERRLIEDLAFESQENEAGSKS
jgi:Coenzyme PQQ synthesis protein D (PqqD)